MPGDFLNRILKFRPVSIGAPLVLKTCKFKFFYAINAIPSLCFEASVENKILFYGGDCLLSKNMYFILLLRMTLKQIYRLNDMKNKGVINQDRYNQVDFFEWFLHFFLTLDILFR